MKIWMLMVNLGKAKDKLTKRREQFIFLVKNYDFDNSETTRIDNILKDVFTDSED